MIWTSSFKQQSKVVARVYKLLCGSCHQININMQSFVQFLSYYIWFLLNRPNLLELHQVMLDVAIFVIFLCWGQYLG